VLGWVNSDDILLPGALAQVAQYFATHPGSPVVYGDAIWIDANGEVIRFKREIDFDWRLFAFGYCYIPQPSTFFRRDAYAAAGGIDATLKCCMDYDLWHRLCRLGPVGHIPAFMSGLRDHSETKTNRLAAVFAREHELLRERYLHCGKFQHKMRHILARARRVILRAARGCYRPLSNEEAIACKLTLKQS
jgi:hypothetical protein